MDDRFTMESRIPAAPPAVGEKNSWEVDLCWGEFPGGAAKGFVDLDLPMGAAFKWSRDMVEFAFTTLYIPRFFPGTADMALISARFWAMAARLTERCNDHATSPRHASTAQPKNARIAPTQMKTVPSGRSDFCMKDAPAVSGTFMTGTPTPASVGAPARLKALVEPAVPVVFVVASAVVAACVVSEVSDCVVSVAAVVAWVVLAADVPLASVVCAVLSVAVVAVAPSGWLTVDRSGAPSSWPRTVGAIMNSKPVRTTHGRIVGTDSRYTRRRNRIAGCEVLGDGAGQGWQSKHSCFECGG